MVRQEMRDGKGSWEVVFNNLGKKIRMIWMKEHYTGAESVLGRHSNVCSASRRYLMELLKELKIAKLGIFYKG